MSNGKTCATCDDTQCGGRERHPGEGDEELAERQALAARLCRISHKVMVVSGKGGVGKSTVAVNLAVGLALAGKRVGLLDVDIHGPSVAKLLHLEGARVEAINGALQPVKLGYRSGLLSVMSVAFLLPERDDAVIWRGPRKYGAIKQFLRDVEWGELDYLVVDSPPGTGDEPLAVAELLGRADGAVVVTTPQEVAVQDVRRCVSFCRQVSLPVLGVVENMSGLTCPHCGGVVAVFGRDGGRAMAEEMGLPFLGAVPLTGEVVDSGEKGAPIVQAAPHSAAAMAFGRVVRAVLQPELDAADRRAATSAGGGGQRIAIPTTGGRLSSHFGHCEAFAIFDVGADGRSISDQRTLSPPPHEPGSFPRWLAEQGVTLVIAGGIGARAQSLFGEQGIRVIAGAVGERPEDVAVAFLSGQLATGANVCDH